jgi:hypothetical protein
LGVCGNFAGDAEQVKKIPTLRVDTIAADLFSRKLRFVAEEYSNSAACKKRRARGARRTRTDNDNIKVSVI